MESLIKIGQGAAAASAGRMWRSGSAGSIGGRVMPAAPARREFATLAEPDAARRGSVGAPAAGMPAQPALPLAGLRLLQATRVGRTFSEVFAFQAPGHCVQNQLHHYDRAVERMIDDKRLVRDGRLPKGAREVRSLPGGGVVAPGQDPADLSAEALLEMNARHGPLRLTLNGIVPPGHGDDVYVGHHAVVLAASFKDDSGRVLGLVVDGNDRQQNAAVQAIRDWQQARGDTRALSALGAEDLDAVNADLRRRGVALDVRQAGFRVVDLAKFKGVQVTGLHGRDGAPPSVSHDGDLRVIGDWLSAQEVTQLRAGVASGQLPVENFPAERRAPPVRLAHYGPWLKVVGLLTVGAVAGDALSR
jgi:hypothetical protein